MMATIELNPYERELQYGYPYILGYIDGKPVRAPLFTMPITISAEGAKLIVKPSEDAIRFNSLPFRSDFDSAAHELALSRLIEQTPSLPLTTSLLRTFCDTLNRELSVLIGARLDGFLDAAPAQPRTAMQLTVVDNAACFIAPKTSYFLVSDLKTIQGAAEQVPDTALGWLIGKRPSEPTSDRFQDLRKFFYPFSSNPSQRRVAHLVSDPKSRITVVQGPPGTGKSLTIANLVCHLVASGKKVLVTSQKDKALQVVDELLKSLELPHLPMTLLRQDRESKQQLRERLEKIQKERSAEETRENFARQIASYTQAVNTHDENTASLQRALVAEHAIEKLAIKVKNAPGVFSRLIAQVQLAFTLRKTEKVAKIRSDILGSALTTLRAQLQTEAAGVLAKAADHRTSVATKTERNQLREFSKLLGRNQTNFKNYAVFDRLKAEPERCDMLLKILPCWIMTPDDVARLFPCTAGLFDVVIIDEASQCDLPSMTPVLYRAVQAVVAGDSKQMQAQRFAFTSNQVAAQAWAQQGLDRLDPDRWLDPTKIDLLQLASVRMDEEAFLDEHYRSLPPIISFSNEYWYGSRLRLMRDADDRRVGDPDGPTISLHRVKGSVTPGTQENELEARYLVDHLRAMLQHPGYSEASFGVICLFEEQMRLVNDIVAEEIAEDLRTEHDLVVVNPDGFQGDERDVILYSLSYDAAGMTQAAISARQSEREHVQGMLNVAFTRARDEVHIFHSAEITEFGMTSGIGTIRDWLEHCQKEADTPRPVAGSSDVQVRKAQSDFEAQVLVALNARGVKVVSQYPSCGYFIDIVAEQNGTRVAVECDGEIWHLDEHGNLKSEDLARQEVLERAGWHVLRVAYRSWRENPDQQLQRIVDALNLNADGVEQAPRQPEPTPKLTDVPESQAVAVDRFEQALLKAVSLGTRSRENVYRSARELLGYSRLGTQIRMSLNDAVERLQRRGIVRLEDDEVFFASDDARNVTYEQRSTAPIFRGARRRNFRRYRRW
jgi:very-short-patch-repair endonuclease